MRELNQIHPRNRSERGIALITMVASMVFVTLFLGLAVDVSALYVLKGRLSAAADAAALAAGRTLNLGSTIPAAAGYADSAAKTFFRANFPDGFMGSDPTNTTVSSSYTQNGNGSVTIAVTSSTRAPVFFMKTMRAVGLNINDWVTVSTVGTSTRRGLVMEVVLDFSGSMASGTRCQDMKDAATSFMQNFSAYDTVGLIKFGTTATITQAASTNWKGLMSANINSGTCNNFTNTAGALNLAWSEIQRIALPLALNTIVLFTDGMPNGVTAAFPIRSVIDDRYGPKYSGAGASAGSNTVVYPSMPLYVGCTTGTTTRGLLNQTFFQPTGAVGGLSKSISTDSNPVSPVGCPSATSFGDASRQLIAYIPANDSFGNLTTGYVDNWVYATNMQTGPGSILPNPRYMGSTTWPAVAVQTNFFPDTSPCVPCRGRLRPDHPNAVAVASMNAAVNQAATIRANATYNVMIHSIYLIGGGASTDPAEREFLPRVSNLQLIPPSPYDPLSFVPYANPAYQSNQQTGLFFQADDSSQLSSLFAQIASSLLRLSH